MRVNSAVSRPPPKRPSISPLRSFTLHTPDTCNVSLEAQHLSQITGNSIGRKGIGITVSLLTKEHRNRTSIKCLQSDELIAVTLRFSGSLHGKNTDHLGSMIANKVRTTATKSFQRFRSDIVRVTYFRYIGVKLLPMHSASAADAQCL